MINLVQFLLLTVGIFYLFDLKPKKISDNIFDYIMSDSNKSKKGIKSQVNLLNKNKKDENILKKHILETENILKMVKKENQIPIIFTISLILSICGILFASTINNLYLIPVLAVGLFLVPFWYAQINMQNIKKEISENLETSISMITSSYNRNENIVVAIEENIDNIDEPIKRFFNDFLTEIKGDTSIENALEKLKLKFDNIVFHDWINAIISCQSDRSLKATLFPIVERLSSIRIINSKSETLYYSSRQEFFVMLVMVCGTIPLIKTMGTDFYDAFINSNVSKIVIAIVTALMFISTRCVLKITQPIEVK